MSRRRLAAAALLLSAAPLLAGCNGPSVPMEPAPLAAAPECAEVTVRLPSAVDGLELRLTNAQATGAWGTPASVLLRCGVPTPAPTSDRCLSLDGIDWVEDASREPTYTYTSYGRSPALEVIIDASEGTVSGTNVLMDLGDVVAYLPKVSGCVGAEDVFSDSGLDPAATTPAEPGGSATPDASGTPATAPADPGTATTPAAAAEPGKGTAPDASGATSATSPTDPAAGTAPGPGTAAAEPGNGTALEAFGTPAAARTGSGTAATSEGSETGTGTPATADPAAHSVTAADPE